MPSGRFPRVGLPDDLYSVFDHFRFSTQFRQSRSFNRQAIAIACQVAIL